MIHIAIIEDNIKFRESLQLYLDSQPDFSCSLAAGSVEEFLSCMSKECLPEVVLMDIGLPGMSGISGIGYLKQKYPEIDIIMLTIYNNSHKIFEALYAGASGYLLKHESPAAIKEAIKVLHSGGSLMSPEVARKVINFFPNLLEISIKPL